MTEKNSPHFQRPRDLTIIILSALLRINQVTSGLAPTQQVQAVLMENLLLPLQQQKVLAAMRSILSLQTIQEVSGLAPTAREYVVMMEMRSPWFQWPRDFLIIL